jgi:hypothetical protein
MSDYAAQKRIMAALRRHLGGERVDEMINLVKAQETQENAERKLKTRRTYAR